MVRASRHGVAATKDHGAVVRPSQLIASVRWARAGEVGERGERSSQLAACSRTLVDPEVRRGSLAVLVA